ncbi:hypothetical protein [Parenemella sanctibonifatiensis]|uniref:Uncharacterized protein n=1 Tax=Parenemella sanctibonifatiensis TaxID=2016505 RepID=A0A255EL01_9ACTN|nr:hypothetical protein [Parenemella sanctibonifatiensis]OYN92209.1 hypothetical protein CGZ91_01485 [Parenemella sanctibonifatiensis]
MTGLTAYVLYPEAPADLAQAFAGSDGIKPSPTGQQATVSTPSDFRVELTLGERISNPDLAADGSLSLMHQRVMPVVAGHQATLKLTADPELPPASQIRALCETIAMSNPLTDAVVWLPQRHQATTLVLFVGELSEDPARMYFWVHASGTADGGSVGTVRGLDALGATNIQIRHPKATAQALFNALREYASGLLRKGGLPTEGAEVSFAGQSWLAKADVDVFTGTPLLGLVSPDAAEEPATQAPAADAAATDAPAADAPTQAPAAEVAPAPAAAPSNAPVAEPAPTPEPATEPAPVEAPPAEAAPAPEPDLDPTAAPAPDPTPEPVSEPEPAVAAAPGAPALAAHDPAADGVAWYVLLADVPPTLGHVMNDLMPNYAQHLIEEQATTGEVPYEDQQAALHLTLQGPVPELPEHAAAVRLVARPLDGGSPSVANQVLLQGAISSELAKIPAARGIWIPDQERLLTDPSAFGNGAPIEFAVHQSTGPDGATVHYTRGLRRFGGKDVSIAAAPGVTPPQEQLLSHAVATRLAAGRVPQAGETGEVATRDLTATFRDAPDPRTGEPALAIELGKRKKFLGLF